MAGDVLSDEESDSSNASRSTAACSIKRGRGRPPTTGEYVQLAAAKERLIQADRQKLDLEAEKEMAGMTARHTRSCGDLTAEGLLGMRSKPAPDLIAAVEDSLGLVESVTTKSRNLKGTFVRALKQASGTLREAAKELGRRAEISASEDVNLEVENARLRMEVDVLQKEMRQLRTEMAALREARQVVEHPPPPPHSPSPPPRPSRLKEGPITRAASAPMDVETEEEGMGHSIPSNKRVDSPEHLAGGNPGPDASLLESIRAMIEGKLETFREEIFPRSAASFRPPLGVKPAATNGAAGPRQMPTKPDPVGSNRKDGAGQKKKAQNQPGAAKAP